MPLETLTNYLSYNDGSHNLTESHQTHTMKQHNTHTHTNSEFNTFL